MDREPERQLDRLADGLRQVGELLIEFVLEPDPQRTDWPYMKPRVDVLRQELDAVLSLLEPALREEPEARELRQLIQENVAGLAGRAAALLLAMGNTAEARRLLREASRLAPEPWQRAQYEAGTREPELYLRYHHGLWLNYHGQGDDAERLLRSVVKGTREPALKEAARRVLDGPRPIDWAPSLFNVGGCGVGLYGRRDASADGSYVTTYCLCLFFLPVLPLRAYRVRQEDSTTYHFLARERLGLLARAWQAALAACLLLAVLG